MNGPGWTDSEGGFDVDVHSVRLEPYLASQRMVVRSGANEVIFSDIHRWAGPLDENIRTALSDFLAVSKIGALSSQATTVSRYLVRVRMYRFEGHLPDRATLAASWSIEDASGRVLVRRRSEHTVSGWGGTDYGQLAKLLEKTVSMLADEIAAAL